MTRADGRNTSISWYGGFKSPGETPGHSGRPARKGPPDAGPAHHAGASALGGATCARLCERAAWPDPTSLVRRARRPFLHISRSAGPTRPPSPLRRRGHDTARHFPAGVVHRSACQMPGVRRCQPLSEIVLHLIGLDHARSRALEVNRSTDALHIELEWTCGRRYCGSFAVKTKDDINQVGTRWCPPSPVWIVIVGPQP
jgi:hypothetical protein